MGKGSMRDMARSAGRWASKARGDIPTKGAGDDEKAEAATRSEKGEGHQCGGDCPMMKTLKKKGLI